jgi:hypothetical protein
MDMNMNRDDAIAQARRSQILVDAAHLSRVDVGP